MPWIKSNLSTGENLRFLTRPHWIWYWSPGSVVFYLLTLGVGLVWTHWQRRTHELAVTDRRVVMKSGILMTNVIEMKLAAIESIQVQQSILGRMLGYGTVTVRGNGEDSMTLVAIDDPWAIQKAAQA